MLLGANCAKKVTDYFFKILYHLRIGERRRIHGTEYRIGYIMILERRYFQMADFRLSGARVINWTAIGFAVLQSICALAFVLGSAGALIGFSLLTAFGGLMRVAVAFHADWIRLPMIGFALVGALLNLWVLSRLRRLRSNPASAWRRGTIERKQLRREKIQLAVALATIVLVVLEAGLHLHYHGHI
jgi:hypothetical protein